MSNAGFDAVSKNITFKLGEDGKHASQRASARCRQVECFREGHKADVEGLELVQAGDQVGHRAAPPIQAPDQNHVNFAATGMLSCRFTLRLCCEEKPGRFSPHALADSLQGPRLGDLIP